MFLPSLFNFGGENDCYSFLCYLFQLFFGAMQWIIICPFGRYLIKLPSRWVSAIRYACIFFWIMVHEMYSSLSSFLLRPLMFWKYIFALSCNSGQSTTLGMELLPTLLSVAGLDGLCCVLLLFWLCFLFLFLSLVWELKDWSQLLVLGWPGEVFSCFFAPRVWLRKVVTPLIVLLLMISHPIGLFGEACIWVLCICGRVSCVCKPCLFSLPTGIVLVASLHLQ